VTLKITLSTFLHFSLISKKNRSKNSYEDFKDLLHVISRGSVQGHSIKPQLESVQQMT